MKPPKQMSFDFYDDYASSIQARFEAFHRRHPQVYAYLIEQTRELQRKGWRRYAIKGLWEKTRWHFHLEKDPQFGDPFRLSNNFHSRYVRLMIKKCPWLKSFFELRRLRTR